jgi:hypothetical protein
MMQAMLQQQIMSNNPNTVGQPAYLQNNNMAVAAAAAAAVAATQQVSPTSDSGLPALSKDVDDLTVSSISPLTTGCPSTCCPGASACHRRLHAATASHAATAAATYQCP